LFGSAGVVSGGDPLNYGSDLSLNIRKKWGQAWIIAEQREQRWLVRDEASEEFGMLAGQAKRNRSAERVPDHPRRDEPQVLE
jgi:hypothetical protein